MGGEVPFNEREMMRRVMDMQYLEDRNWLFSIIIQSNLFNRYEHKSKGTSSTIASKYKELNPRDEGLVAEIDAYFPLFGIVPEA
ncbi:hypothetical protein Fmac_022173 [Flemingia macrophylla]|uniref:Uncharacterized protein n=1 Tax=Flemingia macrophylla TaxID=520843 RepID=A0ABD1LZ29_9FABA